MWKYKIDILKELSKKGYSSVRLNKEKIIPNSTIQRLRHGEGITIDTLNTICVILKMQPSDIVEIIPTDEEKIRFF